MGKEDHLTHIKDVERIWNPSGSMESPDQIDEFIELPLRKAIRILYDKGITTFWSSANHRDILALIVIERQALSDSNLKLAEREFNYSGGELERIGLELPIIPNSLIEEVENHFVKLAKQFENQI